MTRSGSRRPIGWLLFSLALLLAGCASPSPAPTAVLPAPIVSITHAPAPAEIPPSPAAPTPAPARSVTSGPAALAEQLFSGRLIRQISIPAIRVYSPVVPVGWRVDFDESYQSGSLEWDSPGPDVGWVVTSALPDEDGNILLYGHNNLYVEVFKRLAELQPGDRVTLETQTRTWEYVVWKVLKLPVLGANAEQAAAYQRYLQPTSEARLTLISCWPPLSNTHRVVVLARPAE
jgi:sortase A